MLLLVAVGLAEGGDHVLGVDIFRIVVEERLGPAGAVQQLGQLIPVVGEVFVMGIPFLGSKDRPVVVIAEGREIAAPFGIVIGLERDGTAVQFRVVEQDGPAVDKHGIRGVQMAGNQPGRIVGGHFHPVQEGLDALDRVVQDLVGPAHGFLADSPAGLDEHDSQGGQEYQRGKKHHPKAETRGKRLTEVSEDALHKAIGL